MIPTSDNFTEKLCGFEGDANAELLQEEIYLEGEIFIYFVSDGSQGRQVGYSEAGFTLFYSIDDPCHVS